MKKRKDIFRSIGIGIVLIVAFTISGFTTYFGLSTSKAFIKTNGDTDNVARSTFAPLERVELEEESTITFLLLGYGGAGHDGGTLSDVLMLARVDYSSKKLVFISIPRDLWVELPIRSDKKEAYKINMAHAIGLDDARYPLKQPQYKGDAGGGEMAKYAVEIVTGIPVDYFISASFDGFSQAVDSLGGIEVNVPVAFEDKFYPVKGLENETCGFSAAEIELFHRMYSGFELEKQFECRYETLQFAKGTTEMDGTTALKFVRSRHSETNGGDFARSQRQQAVLEGVKKKLISLEAISNSKKFVDILSSTIRTDYNLNKIDELIDLLGNQEDYEITNINLTTDNFLENSRSSNGQYILIPKAGVGNWNEIQEYISNRNQNTGS